MRRFQCVNLMEHFNNNGYAFKDAVGSSDFTCKGMKAGYPIEELLISNESIEIYDIPFLFSSKINQFNNIELNNQKIFFERNIYKNIHILCAADTGSFQEQIRIINSENTATTADSIIKKFGATDWMAESPQFSNKLAYRFSRSFFNGKEKSFKPAIWYHSINLEANLFPFDLLEFRDNPSVHIFCITLEREL